MKHTITLHITDGELGLARFVGTIRRRGFKFVTMEVREIDETDRLERPLAVTAVVRGDRSIEWLGKLLHNVPTFELQGEPVAAA